MVTSHGGREQNPYEPGRNIGDEVKAEAQHNLKSTSLAGRLAQFFRARPGTWIDGRTLSTVAGNYAWRTRVSEIRRRYGMPIENRLRRVTLDDGRTITISEYLFDGEPERLRPLGSRQ